MRLQVAADPHRQRSGTAAAADSSSGRAITRTLEIVFAEVMAVSGGREQELPPTGTVSQSCGAGPWAVRARTMQRSFFRSKLGDVEEPTAPFGLLDVHGDGSADRGGASGARAGRWRSGCVQQARRLGVSAATLFHAAWALVVAHTSAREDVVFGTVLLGRLQGSAGAQRILGMFINTLPLRLRLAAE